MSVLIKGFEMPKDGCKDCAMVKRGQVFDICPFLKKEVNGNVERGGKPNGCPLIDVPDRNDGDMISRQAAVDAILHNQEVYSNNFGDDPDDPLDRYAIAIIDNDAQTIAQLPSAQSEQDGEVIFWKKRAKEYEDVILRFATEKAKGIKLDSIEITGERIIFKNTQPEQKSGEWMYDGTKRICPFCKDFIVTGRSTVKYCWNCGARLKERSE